MFKSYRNRVYADGKTVKESIDTSTKRQMVNYILDSPSLSYVFIDMEETLPIPSIVSDIRTFYERRFLFLPELTVNVGDYITNEKYTYLATNKVDNDIFPQLFGELCNTEYPISTEERKIKVDTDSFGRPIYKTEKVVIKKPCVMTDKIYSQANNSPIPLPDGAIICKLPYSTEENHIPEINSIVDLYQNQYQVSTVSMEYVINEIGYIEVQLQRIPKT